MEYVKELYYLAWIVDISWVIEITLSFVTADEQNRPFTDISRSYLRGWFWFDALATIPPMLFLEKVFIINSLKLLRFFHINEIYAPFRLLLKCLFPHDIQK